MNCHPMGVEQREPTFFPHVMLSRNTWYLLSSAERQLLRRQCQQSGKCVRCFHASLQRRAGKPGSASRNDRPGNGNDSGTPNNRTYPMSWLDCCRMLMQSRATARPITTPASRPDLRRSSFTEPQRTEPWTREAPQRWTRGAC